MCVTKENTKWIQLELFNETVDLFDEYYYRKTIRPFTEEDSKYVTRMERRGAFNEAIRVYRRAFYIARREFQVEQRNIEPYEKLGDRPGKSLFDNNVYTFNRKRSLDVEIDDDDTYPAYRRRMSFYDPCPSGYFFKELYEEETKYYLIETEYEFLSFVHWKYARNTLCDHFYRGINVKYESSLILPDFRRYIDYVIFLVIFAKHIVKGNEEYIASLLIDEFFKDPDIIDTKVFSRSTYNYTFDKSNIPFFTESLWRRKFLAFTEKESQRIKELKRQEQELLEIEYSKHKKRKINFCPICDNGKSKHCIN